MYVKFVEVMHTSHMISMEYHFITCLQKVKMLTLHVFFNIHSDTFFGLACDNSKVDKAKKSEWVYPTVARKKENAKKINKLI